MRQAGDIIINRYKILQLVGQGGMSAVYKAVDQTTGQIVAIKDVERSGGAGKQVFVQSLNVEVQMLKQLNNQHLARVYNVIDDVTSFMLVMEFIEGRSLDKIVGEYGPQQESSVLMWGIQICEVLSYIHNQYPPIIYRDMKPGNIMLQPNGNITLIDFGTARTLKDAPKISDTTCFGTDGFAAPEQYGGLGQSDARTDLFSLGATLYNLITGHSPKEKGIVLPLDYWGANLKNTPLNYIIEKATQRDPNNRYQTAEEFREDLLLALSGGFKKNIFKKTWEKQSYGPKSVVLNPAQMPAQQDIAQVQQQQVQQTWQAPQQVWQGQQQAWMSQNQILHNQQMQQVQFDTSQSVYANDSIPIRSNELNYSGGTGAPTITFDEGNVPDVSLQYNQAQNAQPQYDYLQQEYEYYNADDSKETWKVMRRICICIEAIAFIAAICCFFIGFIVVGIILMLVGFGALALALVGVKNS